MYSTHLTRCQLQTCVTSVKTSPVPDEMEIYNLTNDPTETKNLANPSLQLVETMAIQRILKSDLINSKKEKNISYYW